MSTYKSIIVLTLLFTATGVELARAVELIGRAKPAPSVAAK